VFLASTFLLVLLILRLVLLHLLHHHLDLLLAEVALVISDGDLVLLPRHLVFRADYRIRWCRTLQ
jgi:hypothetical protein